MRSLWMSKIYIKYAVSTLNWNFLMLKRLRSFQRGTVGLFRSTSCKVTSCQSLRFEKSSATRPTSNHTQGAWVWLPDDRIILQLWQPVTLQPVDLQRLTEQFWKDLNLLNIHSFNLEDNKDFEYRFVSFKVTSFT